MKVGKVRTLLIKKASKELISKYPNVFTTDFENNKKLVGEFTNLSSIKLRNRIAGYVTHLVAIMQPLETAEEGETIAENEAE